VTASKLFASSLLVIVAAATTANAQNAQDHSADQTLAQTLFDEAVKLMDQGRFAEACPKLAESQRLDPGGGTLLNLGFCRQNEGKLASAWAAYNEALSQAIKDGRKDRENAARVHVEDLDGKYAKLVMDVTEGARHTDRIEIRLDGTPMRQAAWGVLTPIDRGEHILDVAAPGKRELHKTVVIERDGTVEHVSIPSLEDAPVVIAPDRNRGGTERRGASAQVLVGWLSVGVGAAAIGLGVLAGIVAINDHNSASTNCGFPGGTCSQQGLDANQQSEAWAWVSDFGIGVGAAAVVAGALLVLTAPKSRTAIVPAASLHGGGFSVVTRF
jgi:Tfp pilus assembly protein PilF